jgi:hypothetical protein
LEGIYYKDTVCLSDGELCSSNFTFFMITKATGLSELDGILGFGPVDKSQENNTSIVEALHTDNKIPAKIATFQIAGLDQKSRLTLGGLPSEYYVGELRTLPILEQYSKQWWAVDSTLVKYGSMTLSSQP